MLQNATYKNERPVKSRDFAALCNKKNEGRENVDKEQLKAEIERIEEIRKNKSSYFIRQELKQYLKILKRQLKQAEKE